MFTGIITDLGHVQENKTIESGIRLHIDSSYPLSSFSTGESIACNGVCLTVTGFQESGVGKTSFWADLSEETLRLTTFSNVYRADRINLERSLKLGDDLSGHMVYGHVDDMGWIQAISGQGASHVFTIRAPKNLMPFIARKGSICVDGVSLTVNTVGSDEFEVTIIPQTWRETRFSLYKVGSRVNLEIDPLARYVARLMESRNLKDDKTLEGASRA